MSKGKAKKEPQRGKARPGVAGQDEETEGIRNRYAELGVEGYYASHGSDYSNPHTEQVRELLKANFHRLDVRDEPPPLDLCCGAGEVTSVLAEMGIRRVVGCDPYTETAFLRETGKVIKETGVTLETEFLPFSFRDIVEGALEGRHFSCIICSFALHLCPDSSLWPVVFQLFQTSPRIIILTPHKRPALEYLGGELGDVRLEFSAEALTGRGKAVRLKSYVRGEPSEAASSSAQITSVPSQPDTVPAASAPAGKDSVPNENKESEIRSRQETPIMKGAEDQLTQKTEGT
uniref:Methyltransferase domain-containing protein n=1 Tax=Chromera velia CCMP2878 TaxID=1169474 RepID=A0A0G4IAY2_9ALVE|eukprot:Cvel_2120.t1-p1 / transcript=Cvel_2120.t1 / gene=Cvel_2120 / organism=Chromera_velia_CCMP2878 / gene_product=Uncharacterized protein C17A5.05c, putative / transcript_product=Uncharacterized protein C17A5.05c, putative / location=Cvel_scaffold82:19807-20771(+) / protein_length=288 / sequence_SO=supercontig / SO=protein_coding / is_pseudo=false